MTLIHDILIFAGRLAARGVDGHLELQLPKAAMDQLTADQSTLRRFNCTPNAEGVYAMWGPAGVIVIREREPERLAIPNSDSVIVHPR